MGCRAGKRDVDLPLSSSPFIALSVCPASYHPPVTGLTTFQLTDTHKYAIQLRPHKGHHPTGATISHLVLPAANALFRLTQHDKRSEELVFSDASNTHTRFSKADSTAANHETRHLSFPSPPSQDRSSSMAVALGSVSI